MQLITTNPQALAAKLDASPTITSTQVYWSESAKKGATSHLLTVELYAAYNADDIRVRLRTQEGRIVQPYSDDFPNASRAQLRLLWRYIDGVEEGYRLAHSSASSIPQTL